MGAERKRGLALVIVLGIVLIFVIAAASFMFISSSEIKMVRRQNDSTKAFYLADAGLVHAHYDLGEDDNWADGYVNGFSYTKTDGIFTPLGYDTDTRTLGGGEFTVWLQSIAGSDDTIWIKSKGTYNNSTRVVIARASPLGGSTVIDKAMKAEGAIDISGSGEIIGGYEENSDLSDDYFKSIFGVDKAKMEEIAQNYYHYDNAISNDPAHTVTWVNGGELLSQITSADGDGILIVNGDLKITGGTFNGIIWIIGNADLIAGNPEINGAIFVECGDTSITVKGNATITYDSTAINNALSSVLIIDSWREVFE